MSMSVDFGELGVNFPQSVRGSITYVTEGGVTDAEMNAIRGNQDIARTIDSWVRSLDVTGNAPNWDLFNRRNYRTSDNIFMQFAACERAIEQDDILGTLADVTERVALDSVGLEMFDEDQQDAWEQIFDEINFDSYVKSIFRGLFTFSNCYVGVLWDDAIIQVRTKPDPNDIAPPPTEPGEIFDPANPPDVIPIPEPKSRKGNRKRKKQYAVNIPSALTVMDPCKVLPVGTMMFGRERFAYIADPEETVAITQVLGGEFVDDLILRLIEKKYTPSAPELQLCGRLGIDSRNLWLFKRDAIIRFCETKSDYERWATPRLKSTFELIDLKHHLRASDRATLIGSTNFIVVITKGSDKWPAKARELENLGEQARLVARMPILVGDHRLDVKIVTPATDHTLSKDRWDALDERLTFRALETFAIQKGSGTKGTSEQVSAVVARGLESRRDAIIDRFRRKLVAAVIDRNPTALTEMPNLHCLPRRVTLDINADLIAAILQVRDRGDISRQTTLEELGYNQDVEAMRRAREKSRYDAQFSSIVPYASPEASPFGTPPGGSPVNTDNPSTNGSQGGRPRKAAVAAKTTAAKPAAKTTTPAKTAKATENDEEDEE